MLKYSFSFALLLFFCTPYFLIEVVAEDQLSKVKNCHYLKDSLRISFFDVGQGDAILITCPDGSANTLIDAGAGKLEYPGADQRLLSGLLKRLKEPTINFGINTHPHLDHLGGFKLLLGNNGESVKQNSTIRLERFFDTGADFPNSTVEERLRMNLKKNNVAYTDVSQSKIEKLEICAENSTQKAVFLKFMRLEKELADSLGCPHNLNDCSLVSKLDFEGVSFLFLADVTTHWDSLVLKNQGHKQFLSADVLKVPHHGNKALSKELLETVNPQVAIVSAGSPKSNSKIGYSFSECSVISRLFSHLPSIISLAKLNNQVSCCDWNGATCIWQTVDSPLNLWSTVNAGSIDVYVKDSTLCISSDNSNFSVEIKRK